MEPENSHPVGSRTEPRIALAFCIAVMAVGAVAQIVRKRLAEAGTFGLDWLPFAAAGLAVAGIMLLNGRPKWLRMRRALLWSGLLLTVWATSGLPLDLLRLTPLIPLPVDWPGLLPKTLAFAAAVVLARLALAPPAAPASPRAAPGTVTRRSCWRCPTRL